MSDKGASGTERGAVECDLLDAAPCGFLSFADDGSLTRINATLLRMLGYEREELLGRHVERILTVGSRIFYQTHWFPLLRLHGHAEEVFLMLRTKSGEDIGTLVNAVRRDEGGMPGYHCVLMRVKERQKYEDELLRARRAAEQARADLQVQADELQQANEQLQSQAMELEMQQEQLQEQASELEAASQAKSTFLAVMSHELRTPLNAIAGYVQILEMGIHGPITDAQRDTLERIDRSQRHLLRLINDVLNLARIEAGRVDYHFEEVPVSEVIAGVTPMVEPQIAEKGLDFSVEIASDPLVHTDVEKSQQILLNLLSNAIKFTPAGGRVTVSMSLHDDMVQLHVADTGIGIPEEKLPTIFEAFVQVDVSKAGRSEGSGLGLAISRDLARGIGGDLTVRSVAGEGSVFTLSLQASRAPRT